MTDTNFIYVGNIKNKFFEDALNEYKKRMQPYCRINEIEINEEKLTDNASEAEIKKSLVKEGLKIIQKIPKKSFKIALCIEGKQKDTAEFTKMIENSMSTGITFIIGSSHGLDESVKDACDLRFSFSKMTFPHRLARVLLYEQVYRSFSIINNKKYHK